MITFHYVRLLLLISCSITQILGLFLPHVRRHQSSHHYVAHISPILSTVTDEIQRCLLEVGRASSVRGIRRNTCISRPSSSLYSSAVEDCDSGHREVEVVNSDFDDRPINLFHSVLCGSDGINVAVEPSSTISARTKFSRGKAPIIVLPGLLGSARNFQSWIKLVQQCEIEQDNIHADKEEKEVRITFAIEKYHVVHHHRCD